MSYISPTILKEPLGNNAFSYDIRMSKTLYVPSIIDGSFADISLGDEVVFEDCDENGVLQSCTGIKNFIRTQWNGIPLVLFDNHNHALYFWYEALSH